MNSKQIIAKLIKIANNQQKIIEKLSQTIATPPQELKTSPAVHKSPLMAINDHLLPQLQFLVPGTQSPNTTSKSPIKTLEISSNSVKIVWKTQGNQAVVNAVTKAVQDASDSGELTGGPYSVTP